MTRSERLLAALTGLLLLVAAVSVPRLSGDGSGPVTPGSLATPTPTARATTAAPRRTPTLASQPAPTRTRSATQPPALRPGEVSTSSTAAPSGPYAPLSGTYTLRPAAGDTQTPFTLTIDLRDGDGRAQVDQVIWGDGDRFRPNPGPAIACPMPSPTAPNQSYRSTPSHTTVKYGHAWRHPGTYRVTVQLVSYAWPCTASTAEPQRTQGQLTIRIRPGRQTSNGPASPVIGPIKVSQSTSVPQTYVSFPAYDTDGQIESVAVAWGDGSTSSSVMEGSCDDGGGNYYPGSQPDQGRADYEQSHHYARHGRYRVVVTVYSEGCLGKDVQHTSRGTTVRS